MSCDETIERLPWLLNGTLVEDERRHVEMHLTTCDRCRQALAEINAVGQAASAHLPIDLLLDHADGKPIAAEDRMRVEAHLAACETCREELTLLKAAPEPAAPPTPRTRVAAFWRPLALAAALACMVLGGGWWHSLTSRQTLTAPTAEVALVELLPTTTARDAGTEALPTVPQKGWVTLVLVSEVTTPFERRAIELIDEDDAVRRRAEDISRHNDGYYTVLLPTEDLAPGRYRVVVYGHTGERRVAVERYGFMITSTGPARVESFGH